MLKENYELATWIYALHRCLVEDGYDADALMLKADFDFTKLTSSTLQIPRYLVSKIWGVVEKETKDDAYCLKILPHITDPFLNALITSTQASGSIKQALDLLLKYYRIVHTGLSIEVDTTDFLTIKIGAPGDSSKIRSQDVDLAFSLIAKYGSTLPSNQTHPVLIHLMRSFPKNIEAYQANFSCPIVFEAKENLIRFPKAVLMEEIPSANPGLSHHVEKYLSDHMKDDTTSSIEETVVKQLTDLLPNGTPKIQDIAAKLNTTPRTLQRKLHEHEINFSTLLNKTRLSLAQQYLIDSEHSVQDIANQVGFSEPGNFIRFFKQQTGLTPLEFQDEN